MLSRYTERLMQSLRTSLENSWDTGEAQGHHQILKMHNRGVVLLNKLFVKVAKCEFHSASLAFLGFVMANKQVRADPEKKQGSGRPPLTATVILTGFCQFLPGATDAGVGPVLYQCSGSDPRLHP